MDIPLPSAHPNKGKGGGKGKQKGSRAHQHAPPHEFKYSPCTIPTNFYYDVYKEMGAAGQYKRDVLSVKGNMSALDDHFAHGYDCENPIGDDDVESRFDPAITCRDYDLVLAIKLEKSTYSDGENAPKKKDKARYQAPRNRVVRAWLHGNVGDTTNPGHLEKALRYRVPPLILQELHLIMED